MATIIKGLIIVFLLMGLAYTGMCVWGNMQDKINDKPVDKPSVADARYSIYVKANGNVLYTDNYIQRGRLIIINGYWELIKNKYKYRDSRLTLDPEVFGEILIKRR